MFCWCTETSAVNRFGFESSGDFSGGSKIEESSVEESRCQCKKYEYVQNPVP